MTLRLNEWRMVKADQAMGVKAISNIVAEIEKNKESLESALPKHDSILININMVIDVLYPQMSFYYLLTLH